MAQVYVRWYGNILQGELLDGEYLGMKQVRIPLDGHHPVALFMPWSVYESAELAANNSPGKSPNISDVLPADDREMIEKFKRDNWDHEHNHLRIDKLDEFYWLWREAMRPFGFVDEAEAAITKGYSEITSPYPAITQPYSGKIQEPTKKMLRSTGVQQFKDSTQLALFE